MLVVQQKREQRKWSKAELGRRAGLNAGTVGLIESARLRPYASQARKLARALGVRAADAANLLVEVER